VCDAVKALVSSSTSPDTFVASLCEEWDNLSQWRGYGGFAIGFYRERLRSIARAQDYSLISLVYEKGEQEALLEKALWDAIPIMTGWAADRTTAPSAVEQLLLLGWGFTQATLFVKNPYFRDEREWRLARVILPGVSEARAKTRTKDGGEVPHEEVALTDVGGREAAIAEIVLGPMTRSDAEVAAVRTLLDANNLARVPIRKSVGPLRR